MRERTKSYSAPKLIKYGDMVKLTAAGTGSQNEPTSGPGSGDITRRT